MKSLILAGKNFLHNEEGASSVEYAFLGALIAAVIVIIVYWVGWSVNQAFNMFCRPFINLVGGSCG